jgi:hypothetical protein
VKRDGVRQPRLGREQLDLEPLRDAELSDGQFAFVRRRQDARGRRGAISATGRVLGTCGRSHQQGTQ